MAETLRDGYSATIDAYLEVGTSRYRIGRIRAGEMMLRDACDLAPATEGTVVVCVDGSCRRTPVVLIHGAREANRAVEYF